MHKVYISGALTGLDNVTKLKSFYEAIASLCEEMGFSPYLPHLTTDPINNPNISPDLVFQTDKEQLVHVDLIIAYIGIPSLGVGMELAYAETNGIPIIILYEKHKQISRLPRGIPTIIAEIIFNSHENALEELKAILNKFKNTYPY